ncbi:NADH dehydrogenase [ubiquinone] 1 alpha subcomplex assembly factor 3-like isoform X3 [Lineus longissimus]|uniref:NADH dehydrogenase [ubiquinone] 1 alpha subcomplex assembly factor 3-like isoform X3 n=1 Tax=Lineus longissimus TaxID=88925 RepID=UPI00315C697C
MAASAVIKTWSFFRKFSPNTRQWARSMCDVPEAPSQYSQTMKVTIMNKEHSSGILIDAYSPFGFKLNTGMRVLGPCAIFPKSILHWNIKDPGDITSDSLELFTLLEPKLDILIVGKGDPESKIDFGIIRYLKQRKINVEILNTVSRHITARDTEKSRAKLKTNFLELTDAAVDGIQGIRHYLDTWHRTMKIGAALVVAGKRKPAVLNWVKPIVNHFWHCCQTCEGNADKLNTHQKKLYGEVLVHHQLLTITINWFC